jgi:uncharacterized protein YndB with AHSA1/START domain
MARTRGKGIVSEAGRAVYDSADGDWSSLGQFVTGVDAGQLWGVLADPSGWPEWWEEVASVRLGHELVEGSRGRIRFKRLPPLPVEVSALRPGYRLELEVAAPGLRMWIDFALVEQADGRVRIVQRTTVKGVGARRVAGIYARWMGDGFVLSMTRLISLAVVYAAALRTAGGRDVTRR